jgi:hypothetical protein
MYRQRDNALLQEPDGYHFSYSCIEALQPQAGTGMQQRLKSWAAHLNGCDCSLGRGKGTFAADPVRNCRNCRAIRSGIDCDVHRDLD